MLTTKKASIITTPSLVSGHAKQHPVPPHPYNRFPDTIWQEIMNCLSFNSVLSLFLTSQQAPNMFHRLMAQQKQLTITFPSISHHMHLKMVLRYKILRSLNISYDGSVPIPCFTALFDTNSDTLTSIIICDRSANTICDPSIEDARDAQVKKSILAATACHKLTEFRYPKVSVNKSNAGAIVRLAKSCRELRNLTLMEPASTEALQYVNKSLTELNLSCMPLNRTVQDILRSLIPKLKTLVISSTETDVHREVWDLLGRDQPRLSLETLRFVSDHDTDSGYWNWDDLDMPMIRTLEVGYNYPTYCSLLRFSTLVSLTYNAPPLDPTRICRLIGSLPQLTDLSLSLTGELEPDRQEGGGEDDENYEPDEEDEDDSVMMHLATDLKTTKGVVVKNCLRRLTLTAEPVGIRDFNSMHSVIYACRHIKIDMIKSSLAGMVKLCGKMFQSLESLIIIKVERVWTPCRKGDDGDTPPVVFPELRVLKLPDVHSNLLDRIRCPKLQEIHVVVDPQSLVTRRSWNINRFLQYSGSQCEIIKSNVPLDFTPPDAEATTMTTTRPLLLPRLKQLSVAGSCDFIGLFGLWSSLENIEVECEDHSSLTRFVKADFVAPCSLQSLRLVTHSTHHHQKSSDHARQLASFATFIGRISSLRHLHICHNDIVPFTQHWNNPHLQLYTSCCED